MLKTVVYSLACAAACGLGPALAQDGDQDLRFAGYDWAVAAKEATAERYLGRDSLAIKGGVVRLDDAAFGDGVIEFDVAYEEGTAFIGAIFRVESPIRYEEIYARAHLNRKPDAVQYTPVENTLSAWQIFSDANAQTAIEQKFGAWNAVKIVLVGDRADLYFNSDAPVLHIPDLKTDIPTGGIGLRSTGPAGLSAHFSNFRFRPLEAGEGIVGAPKETAPPPDGLISAWSVSSPFAETAVADALVLDRAATAGLSWRSVNIESNGVANLARLANSTENADTVFIRAAIRSDRAQMKELRFGFSDRVRIYLNGKRVYFGDAGWRTRDYRFLGTVGFFDSAGLDLKKGDNELLVAVSETFGGWAWAGAIGNRAGVHIISGDDS